MTPASAPVASAAEDVRPALAPAAGGMARAFSSLRYRDMRLLWIGNLASFNAFQMNMVAQGYLAFQLTGSATAVAVIALGFGLPQLFLNVIGGWIVDRVSNRSVLTVTQTVMATSALISAVLIIGGWIEVWQLVALAMVQGAAISFSMPARSTFPAHLVPDAELANAVAMNQSGANLTRIIGPSIAGVLISIPFIGLGGAYVVMTASYLLFVIFLRLLRNPGAALTSGQRETPWQAITAGIRFVSGSRMMLGLMGLAIVPTLLGAGYVTLMPVIADRDYGVDAAGLGLMFTMAGFGAIVGSLAVAWFSTRGDLARWQLVCGIGYGLAVMGLALAPSYPMALAMLVVLGMASSAFLALNNTLILRATPRHLFGRVMSLFGLQMSLMAFVAVPIAAAADLWGTGWALFVPGVLIVLFVLGVGLIRPAPEARPVEASPAL